MLVGIPRRELNVFPREDVVQIESCSGDGIRIRDQGSKIDVAAADTAEAIGRMIGIGKRAAVRIIGLVAGLPREAQPVLEHDFVRDIENQFGSITVNSHVDLTGHVDSGEELLVIAGEEGALGAFAVPLGLGRILEAIRVRLRPWDAFFSPRGLAG